MIALVIILSGLLLIMAVLLLINDHEQYENHRQEALQTGKCPFCGERLQHLEYSDKEGKKLCLWCPDCEFDVSRKLSDYAGELKNG